MEKVGVRIGNGINTNKFIIIFTIPRYINVIAKQVSLTVQISIQTGLDSIERFIFVMYCGRSAQFCLTKWIITNGILFSLHASVY